MPSGDAFGFIYNGEEYYYIKNVQNDIVAIADKNGTVVANYYYDAWGNVTRITGNIALAQTNPLRYRSYYYDSETGYYHLKSRYYSPEVGRFLNVDGYVQTGQGLLDKNMFAYCLNNPVMMTDEDGNSPSLVMISIAIIAVCVVIGAILGACHGEDLYYKACPAPEPDNSSGNVTPENSSVPEASSNTKKDKRKNKKSNSNVSDKNNSNPAPENSLSKSARARNIFIGATLGLAVGGAIVAVIGAATVVGSSIITGSVLMAGRQAFAIGALAFNLEAMVFGPLYSVELEPIEWSNDN